MSRGFRFVHNYPIHAHILVRARICAPYIQRQGGGVRRAFHRVGRSAAVKALAFGRDRVRVRATALRSAHTIKSIFAGEAAVYLSIAINYMRAVYDFLKSRIYNIIIKMRKKYALVLL